MPFRKERYPANWQEISLRIRERAGNKCEQCGAPNHVEIHRSKVDPADYIIFDYSECVYTYPDGEWIRMSEIPEEYDTEKAVKVILTVHHIGVDYPDGRKGNPHDKMDCRDENLIALCQRCHLLADLPNHMQNAKRTRAAKKQQAITDSGQLQLPINE